MESQKTPKSQSKPKKKNRVGGIALPDLTTLQSHSNQNSLVLAEKEIQRSK